MSVNTNASTPTPGTGADLGVAANSIAGLLSDDLTIGGTQDHGETREPTNGKGKPASRESDHEDDDPEGQGDGEHPGDGDGDGDPEDGEGQGDGEGDGEDEPEESDEQDGNSKLTDETEVTVEVDGKAEKLSLGELKKGYLRLADYTRKTQAVATERQAIQREQGETREERAQLKQALEQVAFLYQQLTPKEPTQEQWDALHAQDPQQWAQQREYWRSWKEQQQTIAMQYQALNQRQRADMEKALKEQFKTEGQKLIEAIPEWKDDKVRKTERDAIREYAYTMGYSPDDVNSTVDHRIFVMARKAMKYDELMAKKGSLKPDAPPQKTKVMRPGTQGTQPTKRTAIDDARKRLVKSGNVRDAAAVLEKLI